MKIPKKGFPFLTSLLIIILTFFVIINLKIKKNNEIKKIIIEENNTVVANTKSTILDVPAYKQEYIRSCEESSLRMVLAFYGIKTNDMEVVQKVGYDPHPWDKINNIWDDPNQMFVGSIDDINKNGYGTFAPTIAKASIAFGRDAKSYTNVSEQFLAEQIYAGYPVIVWGVYSNPPFNKYYWNTKEGKKIVAYRGEHARVVVGVYGDVSKPTGFLINDPLTGSKAEYWSTQKLMNNMNTVEGLSNQAVIVK